jgi:hypothetical protein
MMSVFNIKYSLILDIWLPLIGTHLHPINDTSNGTHLHPINDTSKD